MAGAVADPSERLPWLADPVRPQPRQPRRSWYPLIIAVSASAAIAYGGWTLGQRSNGPEPRIAEPARTVPLPEPRIASPSSDARPQAQSAGEREALNPSRDPIIAQPAERPASRTKPAERRSAPVRRAQASRSADAPASATAKPAYDPRAWASGVPGRVIQVGAFATRAQAQREWRRVYYRYPLLRPLSPRVLKSRIRGRTYFRLQLGTFSHAHSELLCQRLRRTGQGCIVLRLPARGRG